MSGWWDSSSFSSLATQALKSAQKHIDKVLDIPEEEQAKTSGKYTHVNNSATSVLIRIFSQRHI